MSLCYCVAGTGARAANLDDELDNWSLTAAHSPSLTIDSGNNDSFYGDGARVKSNSPQVGSFYYHLPHIHTFTVSTYFFQERAGAIAVYVSPDSVNWSRIAVEFSTAQATSGGWFGARMTPSDAIPDGMNYIGFNITPAPEVFAPQIGRIMASYGDPAGPGPSGLATLSAGGQTCIAWFPVAAATKYSVKRSANGGDFETIAEHVDAPVYVDSTTKHGVHYRYAVDAALTGGDTEDSITASDAPQPGAVLFTDPLVDWGLVAEHSPGLAIGDPAPNVHTVYRTSDSDQSVTYNLPGLADFAFNLYFRDKSTDKILVEGSANGETWTAIPIHIGAPYAMSAEWNVAACSISKNVLGRWNYLRLTLRADAAGISPRQAIDSPRIGQIRLTYGATDRKRGTTP